jgi:hypothetical protein
MLESNLVVRSSAEGLNRGCTCRTLNPERLQRQLELEPSLAGLGDEIARTRPNLFSPTAVFVSPDQLARMASIVREVDKVVALAGYREAVLARAPDIARLDFGPTGAFLGFDFHLTPRGPQLIEINTNAGGALLNAALARAQQACCREWVAAGFEPTADLEQLERTFFDMFAAEWRSQRGSAPLGRVAIVDDDPVSQYLNPEFRLFQRLFMRFGVEAVIADARELEWRNGKLQHLGECIDLVYNRLTDFYLEDSAHAALRAAYEAGAVVVTPNPRTHALYADKRNLVTLSDAGALAALGATAATRDVLLAGIPRTESVTPERTEALWTERRRLFFKPAAGYGSKAAYRGDKLTRRVWEEILGSDYVAQALVPPSERRVEVDGADTDLKVDVRAYVYAGAIQLAIARLYRGQTTNFRTPGGGFAPVFIVRGDPPQAPHGTQ